MSKFLMEQLESKFKQLESEKEIEEANVTANLDGGAGPPRTPRAFAKSGDEGDLDSDHIEVLGYKKSKKSKQHFESVFKLESKLESLIEATYRAYKKDESMSAKKKVNLAIKEINRKLYEVEQLINQNSKLRIEMGMGQAHFWESTKIRFGKISERMLKISRNIKELGA